jgi:signal transduction histidine kinase
VSQVIQENFDRLNNTINDVMGELTRLNTSEEADDIKDQNRLTAVITEVNEASRQVLEYIRRQLQSLSILTGSPAGATDVIEALEEENIALKERSEADVELAQLGMAIAVISHEFDSTVRTIRNNLRRLKAWADVNPELKDLYKNIRSDFDHLDGYLALFTPLQRRLQRTKTEIRGAEIGKYLRELFAERLRRDNIEIQTTDRFSKMRITGYPSTFYPVFINLVDNSLFWLKDRTGPRLIRLDFNNGTFMISDTGPGVPLRDRDAIFERGFTRKPGGRGMGLKISRDVLAKEGYALTLVDSQSGEGAVFKIAPVQQDSETDGNS